MGILCDCKIYGFVEIIKPIVILYMEEIYSDLIKVLKDKKARLGLQLLDQTQHKFRVSEPKTSIMLKKCQDVESSTQKYGATLTLCKWHNDDPLLIHREVEKKILASTIWKGNKYIMFPEFGSKNGSLHYHGIFYDMYEVEFVRMMKWWRRTFGYVKIELEIRHYDCWIKYIIKDHGKVGLWTLYSI